MLCQMRNCEFTLQLLYVFVTLYDHRELLVRALPNCMRCRNEIITWSVIIIANAILGLLWIRDPALITPETLSDLFSLCLLLINAIAVRRERNRGNGGVE